MLLMMVVVGGVAVVLLMMVVASCVVDDWQVVGWLGLDGTGMETKERELRVGTCYG